MFSAILFDLDGTMVNTDPIHFLIWQEILADFGINVDRPFYDKYISGGHNPEIVKEILPQLSDEEGLKFADDKEARFRQLGTELKPLPGLLDLLEWIDSLNIKKAVVTNAPSLNAEFMLDALNLTDRFEIVILGEKSPKPKPDPAPYQEALEALNVSNERVIAFEDSPSGIRSAVGAGIYTIGVATTHFPENIIAQGASMVIPDFTSPKLWELLNR